MHFEVFGRHWWRLVSANGRPVAISGESFASRSNAVEAAKRFKANAKNYDFEIYADRRNKYRWRATASNSQIVASSGEAFDSRSNAQRAANNVQSNVGNATAP